MSVDNQAAHFFIVVAAMFVAGVLGSYCRHFFDGTDSVADAKNSTKRKFGVFEIVIPGVVAAFIIPLFLSIGKSLLLTDVIVGKDFGENILILFGFCLLASVSARSFVNALAQQALRTADEAKRKSGEAFKEAGEATRQAGEARDQATEAKDLTAEIDANLLHSKPGDRANLLTGFGSSAPNYEGTQEEKLVLNSLLDGSYSRRSITGIANDTKLPRPDVRKALDALINQNLVVQAPSQQTGTLLYQAVLGNQEEKK